MYAVSMYIKVDTCQICTVYAVLIPMSFYVHSLQEESRQTVCGESLEKKNSETTKVIASLPNKFKSIDSYISVLIGE